MRADTLVFTLPTPARCSCLSWAYWLGCGNNRGHSTGLLISTLLVAACGGRTALETSGSVSPAGSWGSPGTQSGGSNAQGGTTNAAGSGGTASEGGQVASGGTRPAATSSTSGAACVATQCTSGGWCWLNPSPQGNSLFDAVVHDGELWVVGDDGLVLRGDGTHWLHCPTPTRESLRGSWFAPDGTLWVVGTGGTVMSFDGRAWQWHHTEPGLFLNDVHGSNGSDIWVVGDRTILHFDGIGWTRVALDTKGTLYAVWANAPNDVWIGGSEVWHFGGTDWRIIHEPASDARAAWGDGTGITWLAAGEVLACGPTGCQVTPNFGYAQFDIWGANSNDIWTIGSQGGMHWDGSRWVAVDVPHSLTSAAGGAAYGAVAVGHFGRMFRRQGGEWLDLRPAIGTVWTDVWGTADDDVWIAGNAMAHFDGHELVLTTLPTDWGLQAVHGASSSDVWAAGCNGTLIHWNGHEWSVHSVQPWSASDACFRAVWVESLSSAWAAGSGGSVYHWDGNAWRALPALPSASAARALFGIAGQVFVADDSGVLAVWQGQAWQTVATFASTQTNAIWGTSSGEIWIAGEVSGRGYLAHWVDGAVAVQQVSATTLTDVWGTASGDVWATGDGRTFHASEQALAEIPSGVSLSRSAIWASPSGTLWMAGGNGILRRAR